MRIMSQRACMKIIQIWISRLKIINSLKMNFFQWNGSLFIQKSWRSLLQNKPPPGAIGALKRKRAPPRLVLQSLDDRLFFQNNYNESFPATLPCCILLEKSISGGPTTSPSWDPRRTTWASEFEFFLFRWVCRSQLLCSRRL